MKCLVIFGSLSDEGIYDLIEKKLEKVSGLEWELLILSAHRNLPELTQRLKKKDFQFIIAGAGLAAHLPGVCAALFQGPVFGVAVDGQLQGLDSFLSISQMPPQVPVLGLTDTLEAVCGLVDFLNNLLAQPKVLKKVNFIVDPELQAQKEFCEIMDRAKILRKELEIDTCVWNQKDAEAINIEVVDLKTSMSLKDLETLKNSSNLIKLPYLSKQDKTDAQWSFQMLNLAKHGGLWLGINNFKNVYYMLQRLQAMFKGKI